MSLDIDMESFGRTFDAVAAPQQNVDTNSYHQEESEFPVRDEFLDAPREPKVESDPEINPQAEHFRALREEIDRIKNDRDVEKREHQLQLDMLRANLNKQHPQEQQPQVTKPFEGMEESDVPNVAELRREWQNLQHERKEQEAAYQARLEELQVQQMYPDYTEVIEKFALPLVKQKPHLAQGIQGASNKALMAYEIGKMAQQIQQTQVATTKSETAKRIVDNSRKPGTLSQAGGQAALSKADYFASMSDQEFMKFATKNLEGI
jgi:hypothetical protein